jgi:putative Ca2+/H+ antiporter (TMEM165/GDT1 family)
MDLSLYASSVLTQFNESSSFVQGTVNSLVMILVTEIGDKTFFIAAVLAMRHGRLVVYSGAMLALGIMHILSSLMGFAVPNLIPKSYTHLASMILFLYFGAKLLKDGYDMKNEGPSDELAEVEEELEKKKGDGEEADDVELGAGKHEAKRNFAAEAFKVFTQAFTLTFLAEWGDRSQIATIALAAAKNPYGVVVGGLIGHAFCTGLAVIGGRMLAARISEKTVALVGGFLFLVFAVSAFLYGPDVDSE